MTTDLAVLVDVEARLDGELAAARAAASAIEAAAHQHVREAATALAEELDAERSRIADEIERDTAEQLRAIDSDARRRIERFDAIAGERADAIAREVASALVALANAETVP